MIAQQAILRRRFDQALTHAFSGIEGTPILALLSLVDNYIFLIETSIFIIEIPDDSAQRHVYLYLHNIGGVIDSLSLQTLFIVSLQYAHHTFALLK